MTDEYFQQLWERRYDVLYRVRLSVLYHQKRERFFETLDKVSKAVSVIGGSAALYKLSSPDALLWIASAITVASTLSLVLGFSDRARRHSELSRNFKQIEADIARRGEVDFAEDDIREWDARVLMAESSEPPALGALVRVCQRELAIAGGRTQKIEPLPLHQRLLAHFFDFASAG